MEKALVVVESPAKAKTIKKYLGPGFQVKASVGHIKDLPMRAEKAPKGKKANNGPVVGVDIDRGFTPEYQIIPGKEKVIKDLREAAKKAGRVLLATDPDREGEAIAWHLSEELKKPDDMVFRVLFNELTERAIKEAIDKPSRLDRNKYDAQQTRRILDRIVGYQLSPLLWAKVQYGLSAGRVQSVALRLIVDRQNLIDTFVPQEHWSITASLEADSPPVFSAKLIEMGGKKVLVPDTETAASIVKQARENRFRVAEVKRKERSRKAPPPFITSTLQQEASRKLKMTSSRAMRVAQQLYEGVELGDQGAVGLITYMRTDSPRLAPEALDAVRGLIKSKYGAKYLPDKPNFFKGRKSAQEAHEAIRPTSTENTPEKVKPFLDRYQHSLYRLIWNRFTASQMSPALFDMTTADIEAESFLFRVTGSIMRFDGFLKVYQQEKEEGSDERDRAEDDKDKELPPLKEGMVLNLLGLSPRQHFTQPSAAFNEASLIKELEEKGIGRPSTYAEIVSTIQKRKYVELEAKKFRPTILGRIIAGLLVDSFPQLLDPLFTAEMESTLDLIEEGSTSWTETLEQFYGPFLSALKRAEKEMKSIKRDGIPTMESCPECGERLLLRSGKYGMFMGCPDYPDCEYTCNVGSAKPKAAEPVPTDEKCPECGAPMVIREGRTGPFLACTRYPECRKTLPITTGVECPKCNKGKLAQRRSKKGKTFYSCDRYPDCDYSLWNKPVSEACPNPDCESPLMEERSNKTDGKYLQCPECKHKVKNEEDAAAKQEGIGA